MPDHCALCWSLPVFDVLSGSTGETREEACSSISRIGDASHTALSHARVLLGADRALSDPLNMGL